ncbi:MAG: hypothetical protein ABI898_13250 [Sphingomonadales bacterium]
MDDDQIEAVIAAQGALIAALDAGDVCAIEAATRDLAAVIDSVRRSGGVRATGNTRARVDHALKQGDAARMRVNYLADRNRQRADRLTTRRGGGRAATYTAAGRYAA